MQHDHQSSPGAKQEIDRVTAAFFRAVTFEPGARPPYGDLYHLFIDEGLVIKNSGCRGDAWT
jgi:hypothetical protein